MKNILKIFPVLLLAIAFSCDESDSRFSGEDPTSGWVEFTSSGTTITVVTDVLEIPIQVNVPVYENGLNINYTLEPVQGDFSSIVTTDSSVYVDPSDIYRNAAVTLNFSGVADLSEIVIFDVVLTSVSNGVNVGVDDSSITRYRISTPCPIDINSWIGAYSVEEAFTSGPNAPFGLTDFFGESYQVEIAQDPTDVTNTKVVFSNTPGFNVYLNNGTVMTFDTCNFTVSFDAGPPLIAEFANHAIETTTYDESTNTIQCDGPLANFGPYQFIFTKI
jgi:hypothetical protein